MRTGVVIIACIIGFLGAVCLIAAAALAPSYDAETARRAEETIAVNACHNAGGIVIRSGWTGRIIDCKPLPRQIPSREPHPIPQVLCGTPSCRLSYYDDETPRGL